MNEPTEREKQIARDAADTIIAVNGQHRMSRFEISDLIEHAIQDAQQQPAPAAEQECKCGHPAKAHTRHQSQDTCDHCGCRHFYAPSPAPSQPEASVEEIARATARNLDAILEANRWDVDYATKAVTTAITRALATASSPDTKRQVQNLAVLVTRLCSKDTGRSEQLRKQALDYLQREGLMPSPLRDAAMSSPSVTPEPMICRQCGVTIDNADEIAAHPEKSWECLTCGASVTPEEKP